MNRPYFTTAAALVVLAGCMAENASDSVSTEDPADSVSSENSATWDGTEWCQLTRNYEPEGECERFDRQYASLAAGVDAFKPDERMTAGRATVVSYAITRLPDSVQGEGGEVADPVDTPANGSAEYSSELPARAESKTGAGREDGPTGGEARGSTQAEIDAALEAAARAASEAVVANAAADRVETGQIKMARFMYACLSGNPIFKIEPETCQSLDTLEMPQPVWRWRVTPSEEGKRMKLQLTSGIEVRARDGSPRRIGQATRQAEIDVTVTPLGRWKKRMAEAEEWIRSPIGVIAALTALIGAIGLLVGAIRRARNGEGPPPGNPG